MYDCRDDGYLDLSMDRCVNICMDEGRIGG